MEEERELELSLDKTYNLPEFRIVKYKNVYLAVFVRLARWIVLSSEVHLAVLNRLNEHASIGAVVEEFDQWQEDVIDVITQIEATHIETLDLHSNFQNTKLHLHLTNMCNLRCPHCYMVSGKPYMDELSTSEIQELCKHFNEIGGSHVSLTGGEPAMRPDFYEIINYISNLGMKVSIFTNGSLWDEERVKMLPTTIEGVQISIDGFNEETNAMVRGAGVFDRSLNAVDLFVNHGIYVKIAVTAPFDILKEHMDDYIRFSKALISKYGEDKIEINYSYFFMPGRDLKPDIISKQKKEYYELVDNLAKCVYGDVEEDAFVSNVIDCIYDSCGYGGLNVLANGDFYFCDRIPDVKCAGNIRTTSFKRIYKLMKTAENAGKIVNFKPCNSCELQNICGGGCRAEHFREFTMIENVNDIDFEAISPRLCSMKDKEKIYDLMIRTYERFYC